MSDLLRDLQYRGLAGAAILFTGAAFGAAVCGFIVFLELHINAGFSRELGIAAMAAFWLACMIFTWRFLYRARQSWPERLTSTSMFHWFQFIGIGVCVGFAALAGEIESNALSWCGFCIEVAVTLFYFCYVFLGITFRYRMPRSAVAGFLLALASVWWSSQYLRSP